MTFERMSETIRAAKEILPPLENETWNKYLIRLRNSEIVTREEIMNLTARLEMEYGDLGQTMPTK